MDESPENLRDLTVYFICLRLRNKLVRGPVQGVLQGPRAQKISGQREPIALVVSICFASAPTLAPKCCSVQS